MKAGAFGDLERLLVPYSSEVLVLYKDYLKLKGSRNKRRYHNKFNKVVKIEYLTPNGNIYATVDMEYTGGVVTKETLFRHPDSATFVITYNYENGVIQSINVSY